MKNSLRRIFALALVVMMIASLGMSAFAEGETVIDKVTFNKTVSKEANAYAPNTTYEFTITQGAPVDAAAGQDKIYAGPLAAVAFLNGSGEGNDTLVITSDPANSDIAAGENPGTALTYGCQIDIDVTQFTAPGIYRYVVAETIPGAADAYNGITYDSTARNLDVYVAYNDADELVITGAVLYKAGTALNGNTYGDAAKGGFENAYDTADLTVTKNVEGNMGDTNKEFSFDVEITGVKGEQYYIVVYDASGNVKTKVENDETKNLTYTITAGDDNKATQTGIMLKDGEKFVVYGLSEGDSYKVTEASYAADGYTTTVEAEDKSVANIGSGSIEAAAEGAKVVDENVTFTNTKNANVPTGIAMTVLPFVAMIALAAIVAVLFFQKRERREA